MAWLGFFAFSAVWSVLMHAVGVKLELAFAERAALAVGENCCIARRAREHAFVQPEQDHAAQRRRARAIDAAHQHAIDGWRREREVEALQTGFEDRQKIFERHPLVDPRAHAIDVKGNLYILERSGHALRVVDAGGKIRPAFEKAAIERFGK